MNTDATQQAGPANASQAWRSVNDVIDDWLYPGERENLIAALEREAGCAITRLASLPRPSAEPDMREAQTWRNEAFEKSAEIVVRHLGDYEAKYIVRDILALRAALASPAHLEREDERETLEAVLSRAMDLIDDAIGTIDKQTYDPNEELDLPADAEHHIVVTEDQKRKLNEAWHLLSGRLKALRQSPHLDAQREWQTRADIFDECADIAGFANREAAESLRERAREIRSGQTGADQPPPYLGTREWQEIES